MGDYDDDGGGDDDDDDDDGDDNDDDDGETHKIGLAARWRTCIWSAWRKEGRLEKPASCKQNIMMMAVMMMMITYDDDDDDDNTESYEI